MTPNTTPASAIRKFSVMKVTEDIAAPGTQCTTHTDLLASLPHPETGQADDAGGGDREQHAADHAHQDRHAAVGLVGAAADHVERPHTRLFRQDTHAG